MSISLPKQGIETSQKAQPPLPDLSAKSSLDDNSSRIVDYDKYVPKASSNEQRLDVPLQTAFGRTSDTFSDLSTYSAENANERRLGRLPIASTGIPLSTRSHGPLRTWRSKLSASWTSNKGLALVILSQLFGVMMNVTTRLLEMDGSHGAGMHPFQILFARMTITLVFSCTYQWLAKVEHAPFGPREVWKLLVARGAAGFFGVYGMYYSLEYLPLSDATVITFLAPTVACWACSILIHEPFTRSEQYAALISFLGVVLIARPASLLPGSSSSIPAGSGGIDNIPPTNTSSHHKPATTAIPGNSTDPQGLENVTPAQRLSAVGVALIGVLGAAVAYTTIRWIGRRAHPLISVNYFAAWSAIVSTIALLVIPSIGFRLPGSLQQWGYLMFLGICGFVMQFLLTAGLAYEKSSRATNMVYTQMLFALAFDKLVWDTSPGIVSIIGSSLILGSALYVAVHNNNVKKKQRNTAGGGAEEDAGLMDAATADDGDDDNDEETDGTPHGRGPLRGVQEVQLRTIRVSSALRKNPRSKATKEPRDKVPVTKRTVASASQSEPQRAVETSAVVPTEPAYQAANVALSNQSTNMTDIVWAVERSDERIP